MKFSYLKFHLLCLLIYNYFVTNITVLLSAWCNGGDGDGDGGGGDAFCSIGEMTRDGK